MFITRPDGSPFAFAGIWETWNQKNQTGSRYKSCSIITTEASESVRQIHHRMPVVLKPAAYDEWLDPDFQDLRRLKNILKEDHITEFISNPVSKRVNTVHHNDPSNIDPLFKNRSATVNP
jgi:putative SOS response-associated peptidase YedK